MKIKQLRRQHADFNLELLDKHRDLFCGGERFRKNVARYLPKNEREPAAVYQRRSQQAADEYINYSGPIANYFAAWLFTSKPVIKTDPEQVDPFYAEFKEDCDGKGTDLDDFFRDRFVDAIIDCAAYWRVEFPAAPPEGADAMTLADWRGAGLGRAVLVPMPASSIINWKRDAQGFVWLIEYTKAEELEEPDDEVETVTETWTIWRRDGEHRRFEAKYDKGRAPGDNEEAAEIDMPAAHGQIAGLPSWS